MFFLQIICISRDFFFYYVWVTPFWFFINQVFLYFIYEEIFYILFPTLG